MYSVLYLESKLTNFPDWFRKRSVYHFRVYNGIVAKVRFPVSAKAKNGITRSVVLNSYFRKAAKRLKEFVGFSHIQSITHS